MISPLILQATPPILTLNHQHLLSFRACAVTDEDIKADIEPGIKSAGHRVLLRRALSDLRARQAAPSPTSGLDQA